MKYFSELIVFFIVILLIGIDLGYTEDVFVKGYYRRDGTYVRPHIRSSPNRYKWDNYGPSKNSFELMNPQARDYDNDGIPNYLDYDDDNDGLYDDNDLNQYGW